MGELQRRFVRRKSGFDAGERPQKEATDERERKRESQVEAVL